VTRHSKYVTFQLAEVAVTRNLFAASTASPDWQSRRRWQRGTARKVIGRHIAGLRWKKSAQNPCWPLKNDSLDSDSRIPARDGQQKWRKITAR